MATHAIGSRKFIGPVLAATAALMVGGVALASSPASPGAAAAPHIYVASHNDPIRLPFSHLATIGQLNLPAGTFTVTAKAWVTSVAGLGNSAVFCKLNLGGYFDQVQVDAQDSAVSNQPVRNGALYLTLSASISKAGPAKLTCENSGGGNTDLKFTKITAITGSGVTRSTF